MTPNPDQQDITDALGAFLASVLPSGTPVLVSQVNRVPQPAGSDFVTMTYLRQDRLATNIDVSVDAVFTGSISGPTMTITDVDPNFSGKIEVGSQMFGIGLSPNTLVTALGTGTGGAGTYTVTPDQNVGSETLSAGFRTLTQKTEVTIQLDVYGPSSADNSQAISTAFRDPYATELFSSLNPLISPLYADDPRQGPFVDAEKQYENRWTIEARLQADQTISVPQQFADAVTVTPVSVDASFPPS